MDILLAIVALPIFVLTDLHEAVSDGFVLLRTDTTVNCDQLQVVVTDGAGATVGAAANAMTVLTGAAEAGGFYEQLCHAHIPNGGAGSVLVAIQTTAGNAETPRGPSAFPGGEGRSRKPCPA